MLLKFNNCPKDSIKFQEYIFSLNYPSCSAVVGAMCISRFFTDTKLQCQTQVVSIATQAASASQRRVSFFMTVISKVSDDDHIIVVYSPPFLHLFQDDNQGRHLHHTLLLRHHLPLHHLHTHHHFLVPLQ